MEFNYNNNVRRTREIRTDLRDRDEALRKQKEAQRLSNSVDKHFNTTYIGALHAVEKMFGSLWADGISEDQLTEEEYRWRQRWKMVRNEILKNGNDERRAAQAELREYTIERNKHHIDMNFNGRNER